LEASEVQLQIEASSESMTGEAGSPTVVRTSTRRSGWLHFEHRLSSSCCSMGRRRLRSSDPPDADCLRTGSYLVGCFHRRTFSEKGHAGGTTAQGADSAGVERPSNSTLDPSPAETEMEATIDAINDDGAVQGPDLPEASNRGGPSEEAESPSSRNDSTEQSQRGSNPCLHLERVVS
jgi:hypothetical protein